MTTFAQILEAERRRDGGRPLLTWYDESTGERVELSVATYANWVAKTASLLVEEHDLERGDLFRVDLPVHWLTAVFVGAAWTAGLVVTQDDDAPAAVVTGPAGLDRWAASADDLPVLACSLLPMGVRFAGPLPAGVHDVGVDVWSQPDAFVASDPPTASDAATSTGGVVVTHGELWSAAAAGSLLTDGGRLMVAANPASPPELATFTEPLARRGSVVLVVGPGLHGEAGSDRLDGLAQAERVTSLRIMSGA
ncbi:TIGR03089 family protein [Nocardioides sp.]|uniref:TIGR03089 family protein n=1 Tax=Nocardioides sp. TaxID=35761 RepID=UPI001A247C97|nr:TIGR03089 family protein [Nocardioides sp.]MBJ7358441.1 TIGR03089 family protein [Nocardioides sp.]